jgi:DNA-directed RNA polymerase subunit alpha
MAEAVKEKAQNIIAGNWNSMIRPAEYKVEHASKNSATFKIEPLERGFGVTLGNAIRRVLLSSLHGAAFTSIRIEGVDHEFSSVQGVKEDVIDIIQNIKKVVVKYGGREKRKLTLSARGPCVVTAGMIKTVNDVEIINSDLVLCHLDEGGELNMELALGTGKGYVPAEQNRVPNTPIGTIPIDSIYSPVERVSYRVENSRVGSNTEHDKLILTIDTDGSMSPDLVLALAAKILQEQLSIFVNFGEIHEIIEERENNSLAFDPSLLIRVEDLELSVRSHNCLKNDNIVYIGDLVVKTEADMLRTPNFGRKSLNEIKEVLGKMKLKFGMTIPGWPPENVEELAKQYEDKMNHGI